MQDTRNGYYDVKIFAHGGENRYRVYAASDYAAAIQVKKTTGLMASTENDVIFVGAYVGDHFLPGGLSPG